MDSCRNSNSNEELAKSTHLKAKIIIIINVKIPTAAVAENLSFISGAEIVALSPEKLTPVNPILR